jgi:hypothetical protein
MGLYAEKEREYRSKKVAPFIPDELFEIIYNEVKNKEVWQITDTDILKIQRLMQDFAKNLK